MLVATIETRLRVREDSQIDFALGNGVFFHVWGRVGVLHKNVSQILAIIDFFKQKKLLEKTLSARRNIISNITLSKTSHLNLDKFGTGNYIPDCRSAPFA